MTEQTESDLSDSYERVIEAQRAYENKVENDKERYEEVEERGNEDFKIIITRNNYARNSMSSDDLAKLIGRDY